MSDNGISGFILIALSVVLLAFAWFMSRAKRVWLEGDELIVVGFREETRYPLKDINRVTATRFTNPEQVRIFFRSPSSEENNIFFYPPIRWFHFWSKHPIAEEIRQLAHTASSPDTPYVKVKQPIDLKRTIIGISAIALFSTVVLGSVNTVMKDSKPYQWSLEQIRSNTSVMHQLGTPIEPGWIITGSFSYNGNNETALLKYSACGPKGKGKVIVKGTKIKGIWSYQRAGIHIDGEYFSLISVNEVSSK